MAAAAILNYYFVTPDHSQSPFVVLNLLFKFCIDWFYTFRDIVISKFHKFDLKCIFRPQKSCFREFWPFKLYFYHRDPKRHFLMQKHAFWALIGHDRSYGVIWTRREGYKKERTRSKPKFAIFADPLPVVPHQPNFACGVVSWISFLVLSFRKIGWKMWEQWGVEFLAFPLTWHIAYTTACCYRTSRDDIDGSCVAGNDEIFW